MDSTQESDSIVYVTLVEAAADIGGSTDDLRKAVRQQQIKGIKENPDNKRSRWLVALEDVRSLYQTEPDESLDGSSGVPDQETKPDPKTVTTQTPKPEQASATDDKHSPDDTEPGPETVTTQTPKPEQASATDDKHSPDDTEPGPETVTTQTPKPEQASATDDKHSPDDTEPGPETVTTQTPKPEQASATDDKHSPDDTEPGPETVTTQTPKPEQASATDDKHSPDDTEPGPETVTTQTPDPETPSVSVHQINSDPATMGAVPDIVNDQLGHLPSHRPHSVAPSMAEAVLGRGEDLIERLTEAVDRFADNVPQAPFDYQALLDKYVAAVERAADAEVRAASLQRRIDDLHDQTANSSERLEQAQAQNRQLLAELEISRAEIDMAADRGSVDDGRPLWKRRNRQ